MSRIFLSHSSADEREAVALNFWLSENGWDDVFLDIDPRRGLVAGERWQEALRKAADRCEAVVFIVSPAWARSKWCLAEFLLAKSLHKRIFGVMLKEVPIGELPTEMTAEWQLCRLVGGGSTESIRFTYREAPDEITFLVEGMRRLKDGLHKAGLMADYFPWPPEDDPQRAPFRGLEPLDASDAAVFFGRDVEILRGLDALRGMRDSFDKKLLVILSASGTGKSSFLRAGLIPRLVRDDRHFFPLTPIRPEREPLYGERGLAHALHSAQAALKLPAANLGDIKARLRQGPAALAELLRQLQDAASRRILALPEGAKPPTLVLAVDQAEELFNADAGSEARSFLQLIGSVLRAGSQDDVSVIASVPTPLPLLVAFTVRSDRYEPLQTAPELAGLQSVVFDDLKPMQPTRFREVILGPAKRASAAGRKLVIEPVLVDKLVEECHEGADTLPLLGLTLSRLYRDYGGDGDLRLDEYKEMGGLANIVKTEAESILAADTATRERQLEALRAAFIPWLATINPQNDQLMRRVVRRTELPPESTALIDALAEKRLLLTDRRDGVTVVEVAHEALLRQWDVLATWLEAEREDLKDADVLERAVQAWKKSGRKHAWLMEGERLAIAEVLAAKSGFSKRLNECQEFLLASRRREDAKLDEEERRRRAELDAAHELALEQQKRAEIDARARLDAEANAGRLKNEQRRLIWALAGVVLIAVIAVGMFSRARLSEQQAKESSVRATAMRLATEAHAMLSGGRMEGDERALLQIIAGHRLSPGAVDGELWNALLKKHVLLLLMRSEESISSVAISPDGTRIVVGTFDNSLRLWDAKSGQALGLPFEGHEDIVYSVAFSPDGHRIVSGSADKTLRLWDAETGRQIGKPLQGHEDSVFSVAFSPNGRDIVSGSRDNTLRLWNVNTGEPIGAPFQGHTSSVHSVAFSSEGRRIVSGSSDKTVRQWDAMTGTPLGVPLRGHTDDVYSVGFSPDGSRIVSGGSDETLRLWDAQSGQPLGEPLKGHKNPISSVVFSPNGRRLVSGSWDMTLRLWDAQTGQPLGEPLTGHDNMVRGVAFSPDGCCIVSGGTDKSLRLWAAETDQSIGIPLTGHKEQVSSVAFSSDGHRIVSGSWDGNIRLWDAKSGQALGSPLLADKGGISAVAFGADNKHVVSDEGRNIRLFNIQTGLSIWRSTEGHEGSVSSVAFSIDGHSIVSGSWDKTVRRWDANTGQALGKPLEGHKDIVSSVAFSPNGRRILSGSWDGTLRLWSTESGVPLGAPFEGHQEPVLSVAFSPDGNRIVSASRDHTLRLWDASTGQRLGAPFEGHTDWVTSTAFSPDGNRIASGSSDGTFRLWDVQTGQPLGAPVEAHMGGVNSVAFSPDGSRIVSGGVDNTLRVWPGPAALPDELCAKLTRNMSRQQWRFWVSAGIEYQCQCPGLPIAPDDPNTKVAPQRCPGTPAESHFPLNHPRPNGRIGRSPAFGQNRLDRQLLGQSGHWGSVRPTAAMRRFAVVTLEVVSNDRSVLLAINGINPKAT